MKKTVLLFALLLASLQAQATNYQDVWWDATKGGEGVTISQQGNALFVAFYGYAANGAGTWFLMQGNLVGTTLSAPVFVYTGTPITQTYQPSQLSSQQVGNATLNFTSPTAATLSFGVYNTFGNYNLVRYNFNNFVPDGTYAGAAVGSRANCSVSGNNGSFAAFENVFVTTSGTQITINTQDSSGSCTYSGSWLQQGSKFTGSGNFSCTLGLSGTWNATDITVTDNSINIAGTAQSTSGETCLATQRIGGLR